MSKIYIRKTKKQQVLSIVIMLVAVAALSIGFAAFSSTLRISSQATVNPDAETFSVIFSNDGNNIETEQTVQPSSETYGEAATIENGISPTISGLKAKFTLPGQSVTYSFYSKNTGGYLAYLNNISFIGKKSCTAEEGTSEELVQNACNGISISIKVGNDDAVSASKNSISNHTLVAGNSEPVVVTITYDSNAALADGPFNVSFGDITLTYSTVSDFIISGQGVETAEAHIGEYVNYVATGTSYTGKWRILGSENGQILLLSDGVADLTLQGKDGYTTGITQMNSIASVYATGTKAVSARSVNVDDINKLLGYDPYKGNPDGSIYQSGTAIQYGITVSYSYGDGAVYYSASNGLSGTVPEYPVYEDFDGTIISAEYPNNTKTLISDYYYYNIRTLKNENATASPEIGAIPNTNLYKMINGSPEYWLADQTICVNASRASWQMRYAHYEHINAAMLYHSAGDSRAQQSYTKKVRAVVTLDSSANLVYDEEKDVWNIE